MNEVTLIDHGFEFTLCSTVGYGRQAICYEAKDQNENVFFLKKLKNPTEENKRTFKRAYEVNQKLLKSPGSSFSTPFGYFEDESGPFVVMPKLAGNTLGKTHFKDLHELFHCILRLTKAINQSHEAGFLVIDLSPENVYVLSGGGMDGGVYLFDFDSMIPVEEIHSVSNISRSRMFAAPEARRGDCDQLCPATDYYTLAALLHMLLFEHAPNGALTDPLRYNYVTEPYSDLLKNNVRIQNALDDFFENCLAFYPEDRFQSYVELEASLVRLCDMTHANAVRPIQSNYVPYIPEHYVRQEKELKQLKKHFAQRKNDFAMAIIHSEISGAGKTTLAHAFAYEAQMLYDAVEFCYWEPEKGYKGVLEQINVADGYDHPGSALKLNTQKVLIIIDNYEETSEAFPHWGDKHHFLFTSRYCCDSFNVYIETGEYCSVNIECTEARGKEIFHKVYTSHAKRRTLTDEEMEMCYAIIEEELEFHAYACALLARRAARKGMYGIDSIRQLFDSTIQSTKDRIPGEKASEASLRHHLDVLFKAELEDAMKDPIQKEVLFFFSIDRAYNEKFLYCLSGDSEKRRRTKVEEAVENLEQRGLVRFETRQYLGEVIAVHSLVFELLNVMFEEDDQWDTESHIFRSLYNLYCEYKDRARTELLSRWPGGYYHEIMNRTRAKLDEMRERFKRYREITFLSSKWNWMHTVSLLHAVNDPSDIMRCDVLHASGSVWYYAYLEGKETIFFVYTGKSFLRPLLVLNSVYPDEEFRPVKALLTAVMKDKILKINGNVSIRMAVGYSGSENWELPAHICNNPIREFLWIETNDVRTLRVPEGVWIIGKCREELYDLRGSCLERLELPSTLKMILPDAFDRSCIRELYIPTSTEHVSSNAFSCCEQLERIIIAGEKIRLEDYCFVFCQNLREVKLLGTEVDVDKAAFFNCNRLAQFEAPKAWKDKNCNILARLPAYQPADDQETRIIIPIRKEYIKSFARGRGSPNLTDFRYIWGEIIDEIIGEELAWLAALPRTNDGMAEVSDYLKNNPDFFDGFRMIFEDDAFNQIMSDDQREELINCLRKNWDIVTLRLELPIIFGELDDEQEENKPEDPDDFCLDMDEALEFWGDDDLD